MGGRRARSTAEILGSVRAHREVRALQSALDSEDPEQIAAASSTLAAKAVTGQDLNDHIDLFLPYIEKTIRSRAGPMSVDERLSEVRSEWARIKADRDLTVRPVIGDALVRSVVNFLKRRGL